MMIKWALQQCSDGACRRASDSLQECEDLLARNQRLQRALVPGCAERCALTFGMIGFPVIQLGEARLGQPAADRAVMVNTVRASGPQHNRTRLAQLRCRLDRSAYIVVADVAEDSHHDYQMGRDRAGVRRGVSRVDGPDCNVGQPRLRSELPSSLRQNWMQLDQRGVDPGGVVSLY